MGHHEPIPQHELLSIEEAPPFLDGWRSDMSDAEINKRLSKDGFDTSAGDTIYTIQWNGRNVTGRMSLLISPRANTAYGLGCDESGGPDKKSSLKLKSTTYSIDGENGNVMTTHPMTGEPCTVREAVIYSISRAHHTWDIIIKWMEREEGIDTRNSYGIGRLSRIKRMHKEKPKSLKRGYELTIKLSLAYDKAGGSAARTVEEINATRLTTTIVLVDDAMRAQLKLFAKQKRRLMKHYKETSDKVQELKAKENALVGRPSFATRGELTSYIAEHAGGIYLINFAGKFTLFVSSAIVAGSLRPVGAVIMKPISTESRSSVDVDAVSRIAGIDDSLSDDDDDDDLVSSDDTSESDDDAFRPSTKTPVKASRPKPPATG